MLENVKKELETFGRYVVQQARTNLTRDKKNVSKELYNSLDYELQVMPNSILFRINALPYADFIDKGVRGANPNLVKNGKQKAGASPYTFRNRMPPVEPLISWAKARNIRFRNSQGQYAKGNYRTIGFWLQKRIYAQGIKGNEFLTKPFVRAYKNLPESIVEAFGLDLKQFLDFSKLKE